MSLALLFPGQASQEVGMGVELRRQDEHGEALFALVDRVTGLAVSEVCARGPIERLTATLIAQPAVMTTSLVGLSVLRDRVGAAFQPAAVAGHSVGELAACVAAGALSEDAGLRLVKVRAEAMQRACDAVDGAMAAVLGLDEPALHRVCREASGEDGSVEVANINAPGQNIISGYVGAVERAAGLARAVGAKRVVPLKVGGPFHSAYMRSAGAAIAAALRDVEVRAPAIPLAGNVLGELLPTANDIRKELPAQVSAPVRWVACLQQLALLGCDRFLEVGHGQVLAGLVKRTLPGAMVASFGKLADLAEALAVVRA